MLRPAGAQVELPVELRLVVMKIDCLGHGQAPGVLCGRIKSYAQGEFATTAETRHPLCRQGRTTALTTGSIEKAHDRTDEHRTAAVFPHLCLGLFYVFGEIQYRDAFGCTRQTTYKMMFGGGIPIDEKFKFALCEEGNKAD